MTAAPTTGRRGGARPGAGRKKGTKAKHTEVIEAMRRQMDAGETLVTPLEVMLVTMRELVRKADEMKALELATKQKQAVIEKDEITGQIKVVTELDMRMLAVDVANKAAPFVHPRLANVEANIKGKLGVYEESLLTLAKGDGDGTADAES